MLGPLLFGALGITLDVDLSPGGSATDTAISPAGASATLTFRRNGQIEFVGSGASSNYAWHANPSSAVGDSYEIMAELLDGTAPGGAALDTWLSLSTDRTWAKNQSSPGSNSCQLRISIRRTGLLPETGVFNIAATVIG